MLRVLVVDDEAAIRKLVRQVLEQSGHHVDDFENGRLGIEALHAVRYDLVITDLVMPEMEGIELISIIKRRWPHVPVIAMSGGGRVDDGDGLEIALELGAAVVLAKPFALDELRQAVKAACRKTDCNCAVAC